jgi:hypothetical protein
VHVLALPLQYSLASQTSLWVRHKVVLGRKPSVGQLVLLPVHDSATSHTPAEGRHTVPALPAGCVHAPALHESTVQTLESSQLTVFAQVVPQLVAKLITFSQPFAAFPSQSSVPAGHALHTPVVVLQLWLLEQTVFEQPQLALLFVFSQPFAALPSQSSVPAVQAPQAPVVVLQLWLVVQTVLEQPQLASVFVFSQPFAALESQSSVPAAQAPQLPVLVLQVWLVVQAVAEHPQLASVLVFSQPLAALASQSCLVAGHAAHALPLQVWLVVHALVEHVVPQLASVLVAFSQPLA